MIETTRHQTIDQRPSPWTAPHDTCSYPTCCSVKIRFSLQEKPRLPVSVPESTEVALTLLHDHISLYNIHINKSNHEEQISVYTHEQNIYTCINIYNIVHFSISIQKNYFVSVFNQTYIIHIYLYMCTLISMYLYMIHMYIYIYHIYIYVCTYNIYIYVHMIYIYI